MQKDQLANQPSAGESLNCEQEGGVSQNRNRSGKKNKRSFIRNYQDALKLT